MEESIALNTPHNKYTLVQWGALAAFAKLAKEEQQSIPKGEGLKVELKINGIPASFTHILNRLDESYNQAVEKAAVELLMDKANSLYDAVNSIHSLSEDIISHVKEKLHKAFPNANVYDD